MLTLAVTYAGLLGGAERTLLDFTRGLPGGLVLACPEGALAERARAEGVQVVPLRERPLELRGGVAERVSAGRELAGHGRDVRRLLREVRPDLLVAWGMRTAIVAPAAAVAVDQRPALLVRHVDFLPSPGVARLMRAAVGRADRVTVNSKAVGRDLDPDASLGDRLSVISPGVELAAYDAEWAMAEDPEVLLLGALMPWKRPDLALEAVARAAESLPNLRLTVAGAPMNDEGERLLAGLRERAARPDLEGRVSFVGELADPRQAIGRAWCLLHCADREPFGNVILQALASGRPVVAPNSGGPAEILDESCGRLYRPGDTAAAAAALVELLSDPEAVERLGTGGRVRASWFEADDSRRRFAEVAAAAVAARRSSASARPARAPATHHGAGMALVTVTHNSATAVDTPAALRRPAPARGARDRRGLGLDRRQRHGGSRRRSARDRGRAGRQRGLRPRLQHRRRHGRGARLRADQPGRGAGRRVAGGPRRRPARPGRPRADPRAGGAVARRVAPADRPPRPGLGAAVAQGAGAAGGAARARCARPSTRGARSAAARSGWAVGACLVAPTPRRSGGWGRSTSGSSCSARTWTWGCARPTRAWRRCSGPTRASCIWTRTPTAPAFGGEPFELLARQRSAVIGERRGQEAADRDDRILTATLFNRIAFNTLLRRPTARERAQLAALRQAREEPAGLDQSS